MLNEKKRKHNLFLFVQNINKHLYFLYFEFKKKKKQRKQNCFLNFKLIDFLILLQHSFMFLVFYFIIFLF